MAQDIEICLGRHVLHTGQVLENDRIRGRLYGKAGAPMIVIMGGISANRFVCDGTTGHKGWWSALVHKGGPVDLNHVQVLGLDYAPQDHKTLHKARTPVCITTHDQARRLFALLAHLQISAPVSLIGSSYGGMVALAFAELFPARVEKLCIISAAHCPHPLGTGWRGIQRRMVRLSQANGQEEEGLALARELAMTTYRSSEEFTKRFATRQTGKAPARFDVDDYLLACGRKFTGTMGASRYLSLSESIDLHKVNPRNIDAPALLIASRTDQLTPPEQMHELSKGMAGKTQFITLDSPFGHDAFLKETKVLGTHLHTFTKEARYAA